MELSQIRYFLALREEGSFTRAARRCGVAQPSLTRAIKVLEAEMGGPLFVREVTGVRPTALGLKVEPHFRAILKSVATVERMAQRPVAPIRVGRRRAPRAREPENRHPERTDDVTVQPGL